MLFRKLITINTENYAERIQSVGKRLRLFTLKQVVHILTIVLESVKKKQRKTSISVVQFRRGRSILLIRIIRDSVFNGVK